MAIQSAAIPYRYGEDGKIQILLVTSRKKRRWVLPKGHVPHGMAPHSSAAKEAFEEGGVVGCAGNAPIASYRRKRKGSNDSHSLRVEVYPMAVTAEASIWPEMAERKRRWSSVTDALGIVLDEGIRKALEAFNDAY